MSITQRKMMELCTKLKNPRQLNKSVGFVESKIHRRRFD